MSLVGDAMELHGAPYHGIYHAVDCAQTLLVFLNTFGAEKFFSPLEAFALLIAALCHDLEHPGLSVTYQENAQVCFRALPCLSSCISLAFLPTQSSHTKQHNHLLQTPLALRYIACPSILESHHCACAFAILRRPESSIFAALDTEQFKQARELIVSSILATDMKTHKRTLK